MFLIDTNVLSELRLLADGRAHPSVAAWAATHDPDTFWLSAVTLFESEVGVRRLERRDPVQGLHLRAWLESVRRRYAERTIPVDDRIAVHAAGFHVPNPAPFADSLIAATAVIHGLTVVTRNTGDFRFPGVVCLNPWGM